MEGLYEIDELAEGLGTTKGVVYVYLKMVTSFGGFHDRGRARQMCRIAGVNT